MTSHRSDNLHALITFLGARIANASYKDGSMDKVMLVFSTKASHLASQNWLEWLTSQAKLVSCQFNARRVKRGYFNSQACSVLSNTLHAQCAHRYFAHRAVCVPCILILECQLVVVIT